jgi:hypothetical protein
MRLSLVCPISVALIASAAGLAAMQAPKSLSGTWGGDRIRLDVSGTGARLQVDCFLGRVEETIVPDDSGSFAITVAFAPLRGVALDGEEDRRESRVTGRVEKDVLQVTIGPEGSEPAGTFTLRRNGKSKLPNCKMRS